LDGRLAYVFRKGGPIKRGQRRDTGALVRDGGGQVSQEIGKPVR